MTPAGPAQIVILDPATQAGTLRALRAGWAASATEDSWDALDPLSLHPVSYTHLTLPTICSV